jgi:hypothetical protein
MKTKHKFDPFEICLLALLILGGVLSFGIFISQSDRAANFIALAAAIFSAAGGLGAYMSVREVRRDRNEREQPSIIVEFRMRPSSVIDFVVRNTSSNIARNVRLKFDPVPIALKNTPITEWAWLQHPFDLPPNGDEQSFFHVSHQFMNGDSPQKFSVTVDCDNERGEPCEARIFAFDFESKKGQVLPPKTVDDYSKKISEELERLTGVLDRAGSAIDQFVSGDAWIVTQEKGDYEKFKRDETVKRQREQNQQ